MSRWALILCFLALTASADSNVGDKPTSNYDEYKAMLKIAQLRVNRLKALHEAGNPAALSTSLARSVLGRAYEAGDVWNVIACKQRSNMAAMTSEPVRYTFHGCGLFHYEVLEVKPGAEPEVKVRVTQKEGYGLKVTDSKIASIDLTMSDHFNQSQKLYHMSGGTHGYYLASPNGVHTATTALELYPLDVPDIYTAEQTQTANMPELPSELQSVAKQVGFSADLSKSLWFDQQDLFGREIEILWQRGDLWPAYLKTANGIAILVRQ